MRQNSLLIVAVLALMLTSCIKAYDPEIKSQDAVKFVVSGQINKGDTVQRINISKTSPVSQPVHFQVSGCTVTIIDDKGNTYNAVDVNNGDYESVIPQSALTPGTSFKLNVILPDGVNIVSDFDQLNECPDIDSVYYTVKSIPSTVPQLVTQGIQFYLNLDAGDLPCRNFKWEATETWEYHSSYAIEWYYNGKIHHVSPPDFSKMVCWKTAAVKDVFTLTTKNLVQNKYSQFPLHFVDNYSTPRLVFGYSLLVRQYALSEAAFAYWEKVQINSNQQGGLYEKQPLAINGNMHNVTHPDEEVLGFFGVTAVTSRRIFVKNVENLPLEYYKDCESGTILKEGLKKIPTSLYPAYLYGGPYGYEDRLIDPTCVDCLRLGGKNVKPDFWPN